MDVTQDYWQAVLAAAQAQGQSEVGCQAFWESDYFIACKMLIVIKMGS